MKKKPPQGEVDVLGGKLQRESIYALSPTDKKVYVLYDTPFCIWVTAFLDSRKAVRAGVDALDSQPVLHCRCDSFSLYKKNPIIL